MWLRRVAPGRFALVAIIALAAATRFAWLDLMEFKSDEANACRLALHVLGFAEPGVGRFFPTAGLVSSVGLPNPPLFVYLMAVPLAIVRSPIAAVAFVAATNVVAIWLVYVAGTRCFSRFAGATAAGLLALSPWGIVFSRKIWAQDLLPICTALFVIQLHGLLVERRQRSAFWLIVIVAVATQLHFSAWVLAVVLAAALVAARRWVGRRWIAAGLGVAALLYAPFVVFHGGVVYRYVTHAHAYAGPGPVGRFDAVARFMLAIVGGGGMSFLIGRTSTFATVFSDVVGVAAAVGLVAAATFHRPLSRSRIGPILVLWYALPLAALTVLQVRPYIHYVIVLLPLPYLGLAYLIERLARRQLVAGLAAAGAILVAFAVLDAGFFRTIVHDGGAPGEYGVAYRYKRDAVSLLLRRNPRRDFALGVNADFGPDGRLRPYRFLIWNADPDRATLTGRPNVGYLLVSTLDPVPPRLARDLRTARYARTRVGPLEIVAVPRR